ncbi:hypothetical protein [Mesonia aquimarina]|uniref:hypothetical protein n=1 Tax=Mesonia aquimarina TaxID=1504967 RepID=UPI000EF61140|nr:hypothetical protein [Mesonia aquimarina]
MRQAGNPSSVDRLRMREMLVFKRTIPGKSPARRIAAERWQQVEKMKITYLIGLLLLPILSYGQNLKTELKNKLNKIDSIVELTNRTEKKYPKGIMEGPIIYSGIFKKNGGWEAYYLRENDSIPLRIRYNLALRKTYESYEFYYSNGKLIYLNLNVTYYRRKNRNESFERKLYFKDSELIFDSNPKIKDYDVKNILETEETTREMIFE